MSEANEQQKATLQSIFSAMLFVVLVGFASYGILELTGINEWWDNFLIYKGLKK